MTRLNDAQAKYVANTFRAAGFGQLDGFGCAAFHRGDWLLGVISVVALILAEIGALAVLASL